MSRMTACVLTTQATPAQSGLRLVPCLSPDGILPEQAHRFGDLLLGPCAEAEKKRRCSRGTAEILRRRPDRHADRVGPGCNVLRTSGQPELDKEIQAPMSRPDLDAVTERGTQRADQGIP